MKFKPNLVDIVQETRSTYRIDPSRILLSLSGGSDSTCLFHVLLEAFGPVFWCCHFNFQLRGQESQGDQRHVENLCKKHNVSLLIVKVLDSPKSAHAPGIENWARGHRKRFFQEFQDRGWTVVIAHHQSDLIENIIFRILRGSSLRNLQGMSIFKENTWKPFLNIPKKEIDEYLSAHSIRYRRDSSNAILKLSRNRIRQKIVPEFEKIFLGSSQNLVDLAQEGQEKSLFIRKWIGEQVYQNQLPFLFFTKNSQGICFEAIEMLHESCANGVQIQWSRQLLKDILLRLLKKGKKKWTYDLPKGFRFVREVDWVRIEKVNSKEPKNSRDNERNDANQRKEVTWQNHH